MPRRYRCMFGVLMNLNRTQVVGLLVLLALLLVATLIRYWNVLLP